MSSFDNKLKTLFQDLNSYLNSNKLVSRLALRLKIKDLLETHHFTESENEECEALFEYPLLQFIFLTITSGHSTSIQAPLLHEKVEYKQNLFYYSHTFTITDELLKNASNEVCQLQLELLHRIASKILLQVGYTIKENTKHSISAFRDQFSLKCSLFCSIFHLTEKIDMMELTPNTVLVVPPGTSVKPFIKFYQQYSNPILLAETSVWLINTDDESISRFIGLSQDKKLLSHFTRSQLATLVERNFRPLISEDF